MTFLSFLITTVGFLLIRQPLRNLVHLRNKAPHGLAQEIMGNGPFVLTDHRVNSVIEVQKEPTILGFRNRQTQCNSLLSHRKRRYRGKGLFDQVFPSNANRFSRQNRLFKGKASRLNPFRIIFGNLFLSF